MLKLDHLGQYSYVIYVEVVVLDYLYRSNVQRQSAGSLNCGVFAIANIVEFCINGYSELEKCSRDWDFDENNRKHLVQCIENNLFPKD